jgi:tetratricopeptide (TPR) repeat protein
MRLVPRLSQRLTRRFLAGLIALLSAAPGLAAPMAVVPRYGFKEGQPQGVGADALSAGHPSLSDDPSDARRRVKFSGNLVWSEDKIGKVHDLILRLKNSAPGLLKLANARAPIKFYLFEKLDIVTVASGAAPGTGTADLLLKTAAGAAPLPNPTDDQCLAFGKGDCLLLSRQFFASKADVQFRALVHEFTHLADQDGLVSTSPAWVRLARPFIEPAAKDYSSNFGSERWPAYFGNALSESLAAYVADYESGKFYPSRKSFDDSVAPLLFNPGQSEIEWALLVFAAREKLAAGVLDDARIKFDRATQLLADQPITYYYLAIISAKSANLQNTLSDVQECTEKFTELNCGAESFEISCLKNVVNIFIGAKRYEDAVILLEPLCVKFPKEQWFADRRTFCNLQLK